MKENEANTEICSIPGNNIIGISLEYSHRVNYSFHQNSIPFLFRIKLVNNSQIDFKDLKVKISFFPDFAETIEFAVNLLPASGEISEDLTLSKFQVKFNIDYLSNLTERYNGRINVDVYSNNGDLIASSSNTIELFPWNEWIGANIMPELISSFVMPNSKSIAVILHRCGEILHETTQNSAIDGYQSHSKKRVYKILSAIFDAIKEKAIIYSNPPASFGNDGQRVRLPDIVLKEKLGTCLDLAILFCSLIEQSGLRPLMILNKTHAYVGCWMKEDSFQEPTVSDFQKIRKLEELDEIFIFETTTATYGSPVNLNESSKIIAENWKENEKDFICAVDINRSRISGIRPLPVFEKEEGLIAIDSKTPTPEVKISTQDRDFVDEIIVKDQSREQTKLDYWKQQLLDLSKRNKLLNFKDTRKSIRLAVSKIEKLEDILAKNEYLKVEAKSDILEGSSPRKLSSEEIKKHIDREISERRLRTYLTDNELRNRMTELYRSAKLELDDSGANTLYLTLGMLEWCEPDCEEHKYKAPILLIPIKLERKSIVDGFRISKFDDDTVINVTLLEMLRHDFSKVIPGLDPLPTDESGIDVETVFRIIRQDIKNIKGWELKEEVWLAQFTFNKFLLWNDLNSNFDNIIKNPVARSIYEKGVSENLENTTLYNKKPLDDDVKYGDLFCPLSYDSSQLAAMVSAERGNSFVLYGPPGTGKSQTITNLIANSLAKGKRVLFVAEKRVALEVVYNRLNKIGLGKFCLELHSNKSGKSEVIAQFREVLGANKHEIDTTWEELSVSLQNLRNSLNSFVRYLHKRYPNKLSAYSCYSYLVKNNDALSSSALELLNHFDTLHQNIEELDSMRNICKKLQISMADIPQDTLSSIKFIGNSSWSYQWEKEVSEASEKLDNASKTFEKSLSEAKDYFNVSNSKSTKEFLKCFVEYMSLLLEAPVLPEGFICDDDWNNFEKEARKLIPIGLCRNSARRKLSDFDLEKIRSIDFEFLRGYINANKNSFFGRIKNWIKLGVVRKSKLNKNLKWNSSMFEELCNAAIDYKKSQGEIESFSDAAQKKIGEIWEKGEIDWNNFLQLLDYGTSLRNKCRSLSESPEGSLNIRKKLGKILANAEDLLSSNGILAEKINTLLEKYSELEHARSNFSRVLKIRNEYLPLEKDIFERINNVLDSLERNKSFLYKWCILQDIYDKAEAMQLQPVLDAIYSGKLNASNVSEIFEAKYRKAFVNDLLQKVPELRNFDSKQFEASIDEFDKADSKYQELTKDVIVARLTAQVNSLDRREKKIKDEFSVITHETAKQRAYKPVRKLLSEIPTIVKSLKPCFLMSPLSVAKYLDLEADKFDILIFDEASQIPVWDAIGAMGRAKQVIVVGDPKQLPPTNFFNRGSSEDDEIDDQLVSIRDLESILDSAIAVGIPSMYLKWHYRSRNEGLIAFSNYYYYDNNLSTFPSPNAKSNGVRYVRCNGQYDRGHSCTNRVEAQKVVDEVVRRLKDDELCKKSIGVITFNLAQQRLIENLLDEARLKYPEIESFFSSESDEPIFVKNLENVQGDERDIILFSICYATDINGVMTMNFGPLNKEGGERRLNVAITRAKEEVIVFSSLGSTQIDLSKTRAKGVAQLKAYLEYAEHGIRTLYSSISSASTHEYDSIFEEEVVKFIEANGYVAHTQVGCSGYRIDIGIVGNSGRYVLGIECDGASYHSAATARDRDKLRQLVLENLGWKLYRIWSTEWWRDRKHAEEKLLQRIREAIEEDSILYPKHLEDQSHIESTTYIRLSEYRHAEVKKFENPNEFYEIANAQNIANEIRRIVEIEFPITETMLVRKIADEYGFARVGAKITKIIKSCKPDDIKLTSYLGQNIYSKLDFDIDSYNLIRKPSGDSKRKIDEVPLVEIKNAIRYFKDLHYPEDKLANEISKFFGYHRTLSEIIEIIPKL